MQLKNILFVDDDADDAFFFLEAARMCIPSVVISVETNGEKLMQRLSNSTLDLPDVIFLDLNMPLLSGAECLCKIRDNPLLKDLSVIIFSTGSTFAEIDRLYRLKATYYIIKPTDLRALSDIILKVVTDIQQHDGRQPERKSFLIKGC